MIPPTDVRLLEVAGDLREQTIRRILNATTADSALDVEQAIESIVNALPMPVAIEDGWGESGPRIVVARALDSESGVGAEVSYLAAFPHEPMLDLVFREADLSPIGVSDDGHHSYGVVRRAALRELAAALVSVADAADARSVFAARQAVAALLAQRLKSESGS